MAVIGMQFFPWANCCLLPSRARVAQEDSFLVGLAGTGGAEPGRARWVLARSPCTPAPVSDPVGRWLPTPGVAGGAAGEGFPEAGRHLEGGPCSWGAGGKQGQAGEVPASTVGTAHGREGGIRGPNKGGSTRPDEEQRKRGLCPPAWLVRLRVGVGGTPRGGAYILQMMMEVRSFRGKENTEIKQSLGEKNLLHGQQSPHYVNMNTVLFRSGALLGRFADITVLTESP